MTKYLEPAFTYMVTIYGKTENDFIKETEALFLKLFFVYLIFSIIMFFVIIQLLLLSLKRNIWKSKRLLGLYPNQQILQNLEGFKKIMSKLS